LKQLTLEHFEGKETTLTELCFTHTKYFIKTKETQEGEQTNKTFLFGFCCPQ